MKRALIALLGLLLAASSANARHARGGAVASGTTLQLTGSPTTAVVGTAYSVPLTPSGGSGSGYSCNQVSATPNTALWLYITPACVLQGTPPNNETDSIVEQVTDSAGNTAQSSFTFVVAASGTPTVLSSPTLPDAVNNGYYAYPIQIKGGTPPYVCSGYASQPWQITPDCIVEGTPTTTGTVSFSAQTITDSAGNTTTYTPSLTVGSTLVLAGIDPVSRLMRLPPAIAGNYWQAQLNAYGGSGTGYTYTATSGLPAWATETTAGLISGTPTVSGGVEIAEKVTDSASTTATATALLNIANADTAAVPGWDTNASFFASNGKLYDGTGHAFTMRGIDRVHYDSDTWASDTNGALSGANSVREFSPFGPSNKTPAYIANQVTTEYTDNGMFTILTVAFVQTTFTGSINSAGTVLTVSAINTPNSTANAGVIVVGAGTCGGNWSANLSGASGGCIYSQLTGTSGGVGTYSITGGTANASGTMTVEMATSGGSDPNEITAAVNMLVSAESALSGVQSNIALNIANEWGGTTQGGYTNTPADWESDYEAAVSTLRTAGYTCPIVIDSLALGENMTVLSGGYAAAVLAADSEHNVFVSYHLYNSSATLGQITNITRGPNAVITFNSQAANNPFSILTNFYGQVYLSGVGGMTQINGQVVSVTSKGGSTGAWTLTTSLDTSAYSAYTSGGIVWDDQNYQVRLAFLASYKAMGIPIIVGEYGPPGLNNVTVGLSTFRAAMTAYGVPDLEWAWDDGGSPMGWTIQPAGFGDAGVGTGNSKGDYRPSVPSMLSQAGMDVVLEPVTGSAQRGVPATVYH